MVNADRLTVNNKVSYISVAMSSLRNIVIVCLLFLIGSCSEATAPDRPVVCDNQYSSIVAEYRDAALSQERREHLITKLSGLISDCSEHVGLNILMADVQVSIGNNVSALAYVTNALEIDPSSAEALHVKGSILLMEGQNEEGMALMKKSIELVPTNVEYLTNICSSWEAQGNYDEAVESCSKAIRLAEEPPSVLYYLRGRAHEGLGNIENSDNDYRKAKELGFDMWPEQ